MCAPTSLYLYFTGDNLWSPYRLLYHCVVLTRQSIESVGILQYFCNEDLKPNVESEISLIALLFMKVVREGLQPKEQK